MAQQHNRPPGDRPQGQPSASYGLPQGGFYPPNTNTAGVVPPQPAPGNYPPQQYPYHQPQHPQYPPYNHHHHHIPPNGHQQHYNMPPPYYQPMPPGVDPNANYHHQQQHAPPMKKSPTNSIDSNIRSIDNAIQGIRSGGSIGTPNQADVRSGGVGIGTPNPGYPNPYAMRTGSTVSMGSYGDFDYSSFYPPNMPNVNMPNMPNAAPNVNIPNMPNNIPHAVQQHAVRGAPRMNMLPPAEQARQAFVDADKDKSGYITFREFLESLTNLDVKIPYADALALFSTLDTDKDGRVVESEFVNGYITDGLGSRRNHNNTHHYR